MQLLRGPVLLDYLRTDCFFSGLRDERLFGNRSGFTNQRPYQ